MTDIAFIVCLSFDHRAGAESLAEFKNAIVSCPCVDISMEVSGSFDLIYQGHCTSISEYSEHLDQLRPRYAKLVTRIETNFISKLVRSRMCGESSALWLQTDEGRRRVEARWIDKILAEGDYMRVHVGEWNGLVHHTMHGFCQQLSSREFIRLHRSCLVRLSFIERLVHSDGRWIARLRDGTQETIAKSHVKEVLKLTTSDSSTQTDALSKIARFNEDIAPPIEKQMEVPV